MRKGLKNIYKKRDVFIGIFERYGIKTLWGGGTATTILFKDIKDKNNAIVCDHLWFMETKGFEKLGHLSQGDVVKFEARVGDYTKGYVGRDEFGIFEDNRTLDYKLNYPTKIEKI